MKLVWKAKQQTGNPLLWQLWQDWRLLDHQLDEHFAQPKPEQSSSSVSKRKLLPDYPFIKYLKQMNRSEFLKKSLAAGAATALSPLVVQAKTTTPTQLSAKVIQAKEGKAVNVLGDHMLIKLTGEDTYGQFTLIEETNDPGVAIPPHVHTQEDEVFQVLEGELELTVGDKTTILKAGDLAFGPRGIPHSWKTLGTKKTKVMLSVFPAGLEFMFEELGTLPAGPPDLAKVGEICGRYGIRFV